MVCDICLMEASGLHFSVPSCRACAAFFRRSVVLNLSYRCQKDSKCDVTKKQRFCCRYCRFEKCRAKGMEPAMVNCTLTKKHGEQHSELSSSPSSVQSSSSTCPVILPSEEQYNKQQEYAKQRIDRLFETNHCIRTMELPIKLTIAQEATMALAEYDKRWPLCSPGKIRRTQTFDLRRGVERMIDETENIAMFCMSLETFARLPKDQKWALFKLFWPKFIFLERYVTLLKTVDNMEPSFYLSYDGELIDMLMGPSENDTLNSNLGARRVFDLMLPMCEKGMKLIGNQLLKVNPSTFELSFCLLQILWGVTAGNGITSETVTMAESIRHRLAEEVHNYYTFEMENADHAGRIMKLMNIISALDEMEQQRQEDNTLVRTFQISKMDIFVDFT